MRRLGRPEFWLPVALLALTWAGSHLLRSPTCVRLSERDRAAYGDRPLWQARFDALSAVCGVGLLTYDLEEDYTETGRWALTSLGLAGAILYLTAGVQAVRRMWGERIPPTWMILTAFGVLQLVAVAVFHLIDIGEPTWHGISAFASLGWLCETPGNAARWALATTALVGAVGWTVWLIWLPAKRGYELPRGRLAVCIAGYLAFIAASAGVVTALEAPRGGVHRGPAQETRLADMEPGERYARSLTLVASTGGAGIATEEVRDRGISEGTKLVLSVVLLIGGLGGCAAGGVKWMSLLWLLSAVGSFLGVGRGRSTDPRVRSCILAGSATVTGTGLLIIITAIGILTIENRNASRHQIPPTLGDAVLEASCAVAGGNLTTGLTATLSSENLSSGIRRSVDSYQYGMTWFMFAMFIGRLWPILVLGRFADVKPDDGPARLPALS